MILSWRWKNTCNTLTVASYLACMLQIFLLTSFPFSDRYIKVIYRIYWITCKCIYKWLVLNIASKLGSLRHQNYYHCEIGHWNWLLTFSLHPCHSKKNRRRNRKRKCIPEVCLQRYLSSWAPFGRLLSFSPVVRLRTDFTSASTIILFWPSIRSQEAVNRALWNCEPKQRPFKLFPQAFCDSHKKSLKEVGCLLWLSLTTYLKSLWNWFSGGIVF